MNLDHEITKLVQELFSEVEDSIKSVTVDYINNEKNPFIKAIFNTEKEAYEFFLNEKAERAVVTKFGNIMEKIAAEFIKAKGGTIIAVGTKDAKPYDLKFILNNQEYWMEMKSILGQNKSNKKTIKENKENAEKAGKKFILGVYYSSKTNTDDYIYAGDDFWNFIGDSSSKEKVIKIMKSVGNNFSIKNMIDKKIAELLSS